MNITSANTSYVFQTTQTTIIILLSNNVDYPRQYDNIIYSYIYERLSFLFQLRRLIFLCSCQVHSLLHMKLVKFIINVKLTVKSLRPLETNPIRVYYLSIYIAMCKTLSNHFKIRRLLKSCFHIHGAFCKVFILLKQLTIYFSVLYK